MKRQVHQIKKEAFKASSWWERKYAKNIEEYKRESAKMKIQLRVEKIKQADMSHEHQAFQSTFQSLQQDFARKRIDFDELCKEHRRHAA